MMLADDDGDRRRKRMWRSDYITAQFHSTVSSLKLDSYCGAGQEVPCFCWTELFLTAAPYPEPVVSTVPHPTIRCRFTALLLFHLCMYLKTCLFPQVILHNCVCSWSRTQSRDLPDGCALQYHRAPTTCQQCSIHQLSTTPTTYWMLCILMRHHSKFPIMPLLLRLRHMVFCRQSWNIHWTKASPTLPLHNVVTLMAPNFF